MWPCMGLSVCLMRLATLNSSAGRSDNHTWHHAQPVSSATVSARPGTMERARSLSLSAEQSKLLRQNTADIKAALQDASVYRDRRSLGRLVHLAITGEIARLIARLLICFYYLNLFFNEVETWGHMHTVEAQMKMMRWREPTANLRPLPFPVFYAVVVLPAAVLTALGVLPWLFAGLLLACVIWRDARLTWAMIVNMVMHKTAPTELLMKQLAIIGSTLLVVVLSVRKSRQVSKPSAGTVLQSDTPRRHRLGVKKSTAVLLGRLLMAGLLIVAGSRQVWRVHERLTSPHLYENTHHHYGRADARDNNWLLLECVLALPLALGLWTSQVSLLLCCALLGEAVMHWQWWERDMPSWHYRQNIRDHFFVNVAVAGGLALMQSFGGGVLTVDALLQKQK